jgi:exopolyphosphatase/pppGpp-phosphohydrolase
VALFDTMPAGDPAEGIVVGGTGTNLCRLLGDVRGCQLDRDALERAMGVVTGEPAAMLADRRSLHLRRVAQLAAGIAMLEAALDRYRLPRIATSDASLREGAVIVGALAGDEWRERLPRLIGRGSAGDA